MISVLIAEDQMAVQEAFATMLDLQDGIRVVATAATGREAINLAWVHQPDVVLIDVQMPNGSGLDVLEQIRQSVPHCRCIILTTFDMPGYMSRAYESGAWAFVTKDTAFSQIVNIVRQVHEGQRMIDQSTAMRVSQAGRSPLSPRETQVLREVAKSCTTTVIANSLSLSQGTVNNYISSMMSKLGADNRAQAVKIAQENGWL